MPTPDSKQVRLKWLAVFIFGSSLFLMLAVAAIDVAAAYYAPGCSYRRRLERMRLDAGIGPGGSPVLFLSGRF